MVLRKVLTAVSALALSAACTTTGNAYEFGSPGWAQKPGITLGGGSAEAPPPGIYMFDQFLTYQASIVGPGAPNAGGARLRCRSGMKRPDFCLCPAGLFWVPASMR
jgi:hypothetical protein